MIIFLLLVIIILILLIWLGVPAITIGHWFGWGLVKIGGLLSMLGDFIFNACKLSQ